MSERRQSPLTGYALLNVYTTLLELRQESAAEGSNATDAAVSFAWDWRVLPKGVFEVRIHITVAPSSERHEHMAIHLVGRFQQVGEPSVQLEDFVRLQAVAILMPYVRQCLSSLTLNSAYGAYYLPPINVMELMKGIDSGKTTGARQLATMDASAQRAPVSARLRPKAARKLTGQVVPPAQK
jgi:preprotein translocase subunit SecB